MEATAYNFVKRTLIQEIIRHTEEILKDPWNEKTCDASERWLCELLEHRSLLGGDMDSLIKGMSKALEVHRMPKETAIELLGKVDHRHPEEGDYEAMKILKRFLQRNGYPDVAEAF